MCLNVLHSCVLLECFHLFFKKEALMKISSYGSTCMLHNFRKIQSNAALINTEVCQEPQVSGCLQTSPARVSCREGCSEHFPVPGTVCPCAGGNTVHRNKEGKSKYLLHVSLQVLSAFAIWRVSLTQDQWQLMLVFLAVNLGGEDSVYVFY